MALIYSCALENFFVMCLYCNSFIKCDNFSVVHGVCRCQLYHVEKAWVMLSICQKSSICTQRSRCSIVCACHLEVESRNRYSSVVSHPVHRMTYRKSRRVLICRCVLVHLPMTLQVLSRNNNK